MPPYARRGIKVKYLIETIGADVNNHSRLPAAIAGYICEQSRFEKNYLRPRHPFAATVSIEEICDAVKGKRTQVKAALKWLTDNAYIERVERGWRGYLGTYRPIFTSSLLRFREVESVEAEPNGSENRPVEGPIGSENRPVERPVAAGARQRRLQVEDRQGAARRVTPLSKGRPPKAKDNKRQSALLWPKYP